MAKYAKFITAAIGAGIATWTKLGWDQEWLSIAVTFLTAVGVYVVPNAPTLRQQATLQEHLIANRIGRFGDLEG
jgi:hypothetical protein